MAKPMLRLVIIALIVLATIACDQSTKHYARTSLRNTGTVRVIGDFFVLRYAENQGAFLSLGANWPDPLKNIVFLFLSSIVILGVSVYVVGNRRGDIRQTMWLSLIIGGGLGNLIDRAAYEGYVTDFMNLGIGEVRTGIFNFADVFLLMGVVLLLFLRKGKNDSKSGVV